MESQPNIIEYVVPIVLVIMLFVGITATVIANIQHRLRRHPRAVGLPPVAPLAALRRNEAPLAAPEGAVWLAQTPDILRTAEWLRLLNDQADTMPHAMVTGPTRCGKTTFASALLSRRAGDVLIISPKVKPSDWGGATIVSLDDLGGYTLITRAMTALEAERRRRLVALRRGQPLTPLTIVLDEVPDLVDNVKPTGDLIRTLGRMGAELSMRVILCSQSDLVADLGLKGRGSARGNYAVVTFRSPQPGQPRQALVEWGDLKSELETKMCPTLASQAQLGSRTWHPPRVPTSYDDAYLPPAIQQSLVSASVSDVETVSGLFSAVERPETDAETFPDMWKLLIAQGIGAGKAKTEIITSLPGYSGRKYTQASAEYERVKAMLEGRTLELSK